MHAFSLILVKIHALGASRMFNHHFPGGDIF